MVYRDHVCFFFKSREMFPFGYNYVRRLPYNRITWEFWCRNLTEIRWSKTWFLGLGGKGTVTARYDFKVLIHKQLY
jgi:hypothetical protein